MSTKWVYFLVDRPAAIREGHRLYELTWKPRYNATGPSVPPPELAEVRYFVDGPTHVEDAAPRELAGGVLACLVDDQVQFMREGSGPGAGGVLRLLLSARNPAITRKRFAWHWRNVHGPLALGMHPSYDYYVTNIVEDPDCEWDGVLEEWFATEQVFDDHEDGLRGWKVAVADDYALFLAPNDISPQWLGREIVAGE